MSDIEKCISSFKTTILKKKLYFIDNYYVENEYLKTLADEDPELEYIFTGKNLGYGAGNNIALRKVQDKSEFHIILNPDVYFDKDSIEKLYNFAKNDSEIGLLMPKIVYPDGRSQVLLGNS